MAAAAADPAARAPSGENFATPETRAIQDDDFLNPVFLPVEAGERASNTAEGAAGKSCASCHQDPAERMKEVRARHPTYSARHGRVLTLAQRIKDCRTQRMQAEALRIESRPLNAIATFVALQSRGMPVRVELDGPARPFLLKGRESYENPRGQLDMRCASREEDSYCKHLRADLPSRGMSNGFPTHRLKEQRVIPLQFRLQGCVDDARGKVPAVGGEEFTISSSTSPGAEGLPVMAPSVRR